jgi:hypothetical protein
VLPVRRPCARATGGVVRGTSRPSWNVAPKRHRGVLSRVVW